jgi:DNA-binding LytR/AlgR family response regulator
MKVLIVEDEAPAYRRLEKILRELDPDIEILEVFDTVEDTVHYIRNHHAPDLAFMDIQISDGISFQIFDQVRFEAPVIFTTAFDEYLMETFRVNSIDYLLKPIKKEALERSLLKFHEMKNVFHAESHDIGRVLREINLTQPSYKRRFLVKQGDKLLAVKTEDVVFFQSRHGVTHIHTRYDKMYVSDLSLDELSQQLNPAAFYRANRQYLIHADYVNAVHKYFKGKCLVEMEHFPQEQIVVSSEKASAFKAWLDQ